MRIATVLTLALLLAACSPKAPNATTKNSASNSAPVEAAPPGPRYPAEVWVALGIEDDRCAPTDTRCYRISWESRLVQDRALFTELIGIPLSAWQVEEHVDEDGVEHLEMTVSTAHLARSIHEWLPGAGFRGVVARVEVGSWRSVPPGGLSRVGVSASGAPGGISGSSWRASPAGNSLPGSGS